MVHERFDIKRWISAFPLARLREEARQFVLNRKRQMPKEYPTESDVQRHIEIMSPKWDILGAPQTLAVCEQLRAESGIKAQPPDAVPTDVFMFCLGEPKNRSITKIGGLPFWPKARPWPLTSDDKPMLFIAQFNFQDSRDLWPELEGDILAVFSEDEGLFSDSPMKFEWMQAGVGPLVEKLPHPALGFEPMYGQIHRTWDHPELGIFEATKIGGTPNWIQEEPTLPATHLATLGSYRQIWDKRWPFINREEVVRFGERPETFMIGDMGQIHLQLTSDGSVQAETECY